MTSEEMQHTKEFMLRHQATFEANFRRSMEALQQQQAQSAADMMRIKELGGELAKSHVRMQNALADLTESHKKLAESQCETEEQLRRVLKAVERGFGGNGRARKTS